jgi:hypothetical protein
MWPLFALKHAHVPRMVSSTAIDHAKSRFRSNLFYSIIVNVGWQGEGKFAYHSPTICHPQASKLVNDVKSEPLLHLQHERWSPITKIMRELLYNRILSLRARSRRCTSTFFPPFDVDTSNHQPQGEDHFHPTRKQDNVHIEVGEKQGGKTIDQIGKTVHQ